MKLPDNIKMIFFDFDDTLFVHYSNQRFGNDDKIMKELEKAELCAAGSGYQVYDRLGSVNHLMKEFIEEDTKGIPKFCITWVVNSNMLPYKKQWLDKYYPGEIKTIYGTSIPEQKINTMKQLAGIYSIKAENILFIDNKYDTVAQAIKSGITGMTTVEVMAKKCEERRWGGHTTDEV